MFCQFLSLLLIVLGTARADIAVDRGASTPTFLFFQDHDRVVRGLCKDGILFDRSQCDSQLASVMALPLFLRTADGVGDGLAAHEQVLGDLYVAVKRLDTRLLEMVSASPTPGNLAELRNELEALELKIVERTSVITELEAQIKKIDLALAQHPNADLVAQRLVVIAKRDREVLARAALQDDQEQLRGDYVAQASSLHNDATFQSLMRQRQEKIRRIDSERAAMVTLMNHKAAAQRLVAMVRDDGLTFELRFDTAEFVLERELAAKLQEKFVKLVEEEAAVALAARKAAYIRTVLEPLLNQTRRYGNCASVSQSCPALITLEGSKWYPDAGVGHITVAMTITSEMRKAFSPEVKQGFTETMTCELMGNATFQVRCRSEGHDYDLNVSNHPFWNYYLYVDFDSPGKTLSVSDVEDYDWGPQLRRFNCQSLNCATQ